MEKETNVKCFHQGCKKKVITTKEGFVTLHCKKHSTSCYWKNCKRKRWGTFFCKLHYLAKEANYGINDTDPNKKWADEKTKQDFYKWGVKRMRDFAMYVIDEGII